MRITINAFGTRGDVQPYIALALGLQGAGHQVRLTTHRIFESWIREYDLDFFPLDVDPRQALVTQALAELGGNTFRITRWMEENFKPILGDIFKATLQSAQDVDLLLNSGLSFAGWHVAEKLGIPAVGAYLWPATPTHAFPGAASPIPPAWLPFKGIYNFASAKLAHQFFFYILRPLSNACRDEILDLPPLSMAYYWRLDRPDARVPILYGYSPTVIPRPPDWGDSQQISGYWFLDSAQDYKPPQRLLEFLNSGAPPIYLGFGSMVDHEREAMTRIVTAALEKTGQRGILLGGWSELGADDLPDTILRLDYAPHDWLFPKVAAVVHHGGAGTTAAGLRAGVPTVVVSFFGDQLFWGWRVYDLGAGPKWIPRKQLTVDNLAAAIEQALTDKMMRQRAAKLGENIRAENGVTKCVEIIEHFASLSPWV